MGAERLFWELWKCSNESQVDEFISHTPELQNPNNWRPLGGNMNNLGIVENQQASPVAALVEKVVNSIDAVLMRKCYEEGVNPESNAAPQSIEKAVEKYFPYLKYPDQCTKRRKLAQQIQILADSAPESRNDISIIVYDAGEGQHPEDFEDTFCSLLRNNKNKIHFVQGRYNMGGSGALPFCGEKRYQLIGSKRYDGKGNFGFTLIRKHPRSAQEERETKNSWYEYLVWKRCIAAFPIEQLDLGLHASLFTTGSVIKLYSYDTLGNRDMLRDMRRSLNEYLFNPTLPYYLVQEESRVREHRKAETAFGLRDRLEDSEHVEHKFNQRIEDSRIGKIGITNYVFPARMVGKDAKDTREFTKKEFFKNGMCVLFTLNGQVHAHFTTEFISRTLKYQLLKDSLLIHVDCTEMAPAYREELFMASRDRLKGSEKTKEFRQRLGMVLQQGQLKEIHKQRRANILALHTADKDALIKEIGRNLPLNEDIRRLWGQSLQLDARQKKTQHTTPNDEEIEPKPAFMSNRYPSFFNLANHGKKGNDFFEIPLSGSKSILFNSDVENEYFNRVEDPGELTLGVMTWRTKDNEGGNQRGTVNKISELLSVERQSPRDGEIKVVLRPTEEVQVGDEIEVEADLRDNASPDGFNPLSFWVKIADSRRTQTPKKSLVDEEPLTLPDIVLTKESLGEDDGNIVSWDKLDIPMDHGVVMYPVSGEEEKVIERVIVNLDCRVFKNHRSKCKSFEEIEREQNRFISSVYYHTLFLYTISLQRGHQHTVRLKNGNIREEENVEMSEYIQDIFANHYVDFLLNFRLEEVIEADD